MNKIKWFYLLLIFTLVACSPAPSPSPTPEAAIDPASLATEVIRTYQAQLSQTVPPSPDAVQTTPTGSLTPQPDNSTPEITSFPPTPANLPDKALLLGQRPTDEDEVGLAHKFPAVWTIKNIGTTTWNRDYKIRYYAGLDMADKRVYAFTKDVPPGGQINLTVNMVSPNYPGHFKTIWVITNDKDQNFYTVYLSLTFMKGPTRTSTRRPTKTPGTPTPGY